MMATLGARAVEADSDGLDGHAAVGLTKKPNDLFFRVSLLHVQSPSKFRLDSNVTCYSRWGGSQGSDGLFR